MEKNRRLKTGSPNPIIFRDWAKEVKSNQRGTEGKKIDKSALFWKMRMKTVSREKE